MRIGLFAVLLLFLAACAPTAESETPTAAPATSPTSTPTLTPTPTETPTPTPEPITLTGTFGLPEEIAQKFAGAEKYITRAPDGSYQVTALGRDPQTGAIDVLDFTLLPETFSTNEDLKNPLAPLTLRAVDANGQEFTLLWNEKTAEFRLAPNFQELYTGVNTDAPRLNEEALAGIPAFTVEDIQSGFAVQSLLAHILDRMDQGESLADILYMDPDAVRQNWQKLGGNSLLFELLPEGKLASLKAKGNDQSAQDFRYNNATMKALPFGANIEINGQNYFAFYIANFDPIDPQNPDPNNLSNWKFFLSIPTYAGNPVDIQDPIVNWKDAFRKNNPLTVYALLYGDEKYQQNHPLLSQLLSIEGNDASKMEYIDNNVFALAHNINGRIAQIDSTNPIFETQSLSRPLPPQLQQMLFPFEVGTWK